MNGIAQLNLCVSANFSLLVLFMSTRAIAAILHVGDKGEFDPFSSSPTVGPTLIKVH